jgi:hypothetical protein
MAATTYRVIASLGDATGAIGSAGSTFYAPLIGELILYSSAAGVQTRFREAYTLGNLFVYILTNSISNASSLKLSVNGGAGGNPQVSITANTTGIFEDTANTTAIASGNTANWVLAVGAAKHTDAASFTVSQIGCTLAHSGNISLLQGTLSPSTSWGSTVSYYGFFGRLYPMTTGSEVYIENTIRTVTTMSYMRLYVTAHSDATNSTAYFRKNNANGNQTISIAGSATGEFEDSVNSDSVGVGDKVNIQWTPPAGTVGISVVSVKSDSTARLSGTTYASVTSGGTYYCAVEGHLSGSSETPVQTTMRVAQTAIRMSVYCAQYSGGGSAITLRKGAADTTLTVSLTGTGWFSDLVNSVSVAATDKLDYKIASTGGTNIHRINMEYPGPAAAGPTNVKTVHGLVIASVKSMQGLAIASVKSIQGVT